MSSKFATFTADNLVSSTIDYETVEDITVPEFLYRKYKEVDPKTPFLVDAFTKEQLSYGDFMSKVQSLALAIVDLGIKPTDMMIFFDDNSFAYAVAYFATIFAGVPLWQISPSYGAFEVAQRISNVPDKSVVFFYGSSRRSTVKEIHQNFEDLVGDRLKFEIEMNRLTGENEDEKYGSPVGELKISDLIEKFAGVELQNIPYFPVANVHESMSVLVCTSGTTGPPKGAMHSQYSMVNFLKNISEQLRPDRGPKTLLFFAIGHISGSMFMPLEFCLGATLYLAHTITTEQMMKLIQSEKINQALIAPINVHEIATGNYHTEYDLSSFKIAYTGGTIMAANLADMWAEKLPNCPLLNFYGMSEFLCPLLSRNPEHKNSLAISGTVSPATEMKIVCTETGRALPQGQSGEICLRGPARFMGYYLNPAATASAIDSEGFYHSGDVGYVDKNLCLHVHDRIKEMIKVYSCSVFPTEIEQLIQLKFPDVSAACVVGISLPSGDAHLRAYLTVRDGSKLTEQEVIDTVAANFIYYKRLKGGVVFIPEMPRTLIGKIDRQYFKRLIQSGA